MTTYRVTVAIRLRDEPENHFVPEPRELGLSGNLLFSR
jgi:hypothetical protein